MKILKSGIEMTPKELNQIKGGWCACGCEGGFNSHNLHASGSEDGECICGCTSGPDTWTSPEVSARTYPW
jgi:hypothetical protein